MNDTSEESYARRLHTKEQAGWKQALNVQAPYQWNLRRQQLGRTLEIGCGIGRNLASLPPGSIGVDHNTTSVALARERGFTAYTVTEWQASAERVPGAFAGLLLAHVIEHMSAPEGEQLLRDYLPYLRPGGRVFFVCPQERGFASDPTHVRFTTGTDLADLARTVGLEAAAPYSFPFPRWAGRAFVYNEFCLRAEKPSS